MAKDLWNAFSSRFVELWNQCGRDGTTCTPNCIFDDGDVGMTALDLVQSAYMRTLFQDAMLFGGCVMGAVMTLIIKRNCVKWLFDSLGPFEFHAHFIELGPDGPWVATKYSNAVHPLV